MQKRFALVVLAALGCVMVIAPAFAGVTVDEKCAALKMKAASKLFAAEAKCYGKALVETAVASEDCLSGARQKFADAITKAEEGGGCLAGGGASTVRTKLEATLEDITGDLGCGNHLVEGDEECDDGNEVDGDGCSSTCHSGICGNGVVDVQIGEVCDDGGESGGDGCNSDCRTTEVGWSCTSEGQPCTPIYGDGRIVGNEVCDNGGGNDDGCDSLGQPETGWQCSSVACTPIAGDGLIVGDEECDDRNTDSGDGCSNLMKTETGWTCQASGISPSVCTPICGDGRIIGDEQCDNGNDSCADGCDNRCTTEPGYDCTGEPSVCTPH